MARPSNPKTKVLQKYRKQVTARAKISSARKRKKMATTVRRLKSLITNLG